MIKLKKMSFQLHDILFFFLILVSFYFTRNIICSFMMLIFVGYTVLRMLLIRQKMLIPTFCLGFLIFILYGSANIYMRNVLYVSVAQTMVKSLILNLIMMWSIIQYINIQKDNYKILRIFETSIMLINITVIIMSLGSITEGRLATGTDVNANVFSMLSVYGIILIIYFRRINEITEIAYWARILMYISSILLAGSRKGLIMLIVAIFIVNIGKQKKKIFKTVLLSLGIAGVLYILIMNVSVLYNIIGNRVESLFQFLSDGQTEDSSLNSRQQLVQIGMNYIRQKPITGYGYDCFKMVSGINGGGKVGAGEVGYYAHNNYVELLFSGGIIGLILYYLPFIHLLRQLIKQYKKDFTIVFISAILISKMAIEYAYVSYYSRIDAYVTAIVIGCLIVVRKKKAQINYL